jgi:hypothetical protein
MLVISAQINQEDIRNLLQSYSSALVRKAVRSALDRTGTWGKNYLADDVSANYNLSNSRVKKAITVSRTTQTRLEVALNVKGAQLSILDDFGAIQDSAGISANISRTSVFRVPHAFINVARRGGGRFIAIRTSRSRYPTSGKPGRGPSLPMLVNRMNHREKMESDLTDHLYKELQDQIAKRTLGSAGTAA